MKKLVMAVMMATSLAAVADNFGFTYQAELKDGEGKNLSSRNQTVEIRLWDSATGTDGLLWGRTYNIYTDQNGLFNQEVSDDLGSATSDDPGVKLADVFSKMSPGGVYIGLKVKDSSGEIVPRQRLFAVPFASKANTAVDLVGATHAVEGTLKIGKTASLSAGGLDLAETSTSTVGVLTVSSLTAKGGEIAVKNLSFTEKLTDANGKEVIPVPIGGIIMWTKSTLPDNEHWAICDGSTKNGVTTPDLSGRFIVGVGTSASGTNYVYGAKGGEEAHKLTTAEMPSHNHTINNVGGGKSMRGGSDGYYTDFMRGHYADGWPIDPKTVIQNAGGDQAHENRPPYYALYYIMRVK